MDRTGRTLPRRAAAALLAALLPALSAAATRRPAEAVAGRVLTPDPAGLEALWVEARRGSRAERAAVAPDGSFAVDLPAGAGEPVEILVEPAGPVRRHHPSLVRLPPGAPGGEQRVVLVPRVWPVRAGKHAGTPVEISLARAFAPSCRGCSSFFRGDDLGPDAPRPDAHPTWPAGAFPIRLAFGPGAPAAGVSARDSAVFWGIVAEMEAELGRDLFRPVPHRATLPDERGAPEDVVLVEFDPRLRRVGWGSTISQTGDIFYGAIRVRGPRVFAEREGPHLVKHELMHALGVGHTCGWTSLMAQLPECGSRVSGSVTAEDAAYFEVLTAVRELQRAVGAGIGLGAALDGERAAPGRP